MRENRTAEINYEDYLTAVYYAIIGQDEIVARLFGSSPLLERERFESYCALFEETLDSVYGDHFIDTLTASKRRTDIESIEKMLLSRNTGYKLYRFAAIIDPYQLRQIEPGTRTEIIECIASSAEYGIHFLYTFNLHHGIIPELVPESDAGESTNATADTGNVDTGNVYEGELTLLCGSEKTENESQYLCIDRNVEGHSVSILKNKDNTHSFILKANNGSFLNKTITITLSYAKGDKKTIREKCLEEIDEFWILCEYPIEPDTRIFYKIEDIKD